MSIHEEIELQGCPFCGGAGLLEEENGWCWYVMCMDCGAQTAAMEFRTPEERPEQGGVSVEHRQGRARGHRGMKYIVKRLPHVRQPFFMLTGSIK